jgi:hypothetical protein
MPNHRSQLEILNAQRQILLAESELNRIQLTQDIRRLRDEYHRMAETFKAARSIVSSAARIGGFFLLFRRFIRHKQTQPKPSTNGSFISALFNGMKTGLSLWETFRSRH